ncbi:MAG: CPBP family intramembrane metalloprotease [Bacteroidales bacterium]|nr:CPBP family intramembrane metalloprotease [Bacteroidales bacterium]
MTKSLTVSLLIAATLWFLMFSPWTSGWFNFWWAMSASAIILTTCAIIGLKGHLNIWSNSAQQNLTNLGLSVLIAIVLWGVFYIGDKLSQSLFDFARPQVDLIYGMKSELSPQIIACLLLLVIGPAEEIFWRGYIQRSLTRQMNPTLAFILSTALYTLVHLPSLNFMLIMAAMTCGLAWGGLYRLFPNRLPAIILSHALWDAAAFVWFPF